MRKSTSIITVTTLVALLSLTGCSTKNAQQQNIQLKEQTKVEDTQKTLTINEGAQNMRTALKNMKGMISSKDDDAAIKEGAKLEENWSPIEDNVKSKNTAIYEKVEGPLDVINAGIKVKPLDTKTLTSAIDSLDNILSEVQKLK